MAVALSSTKRNKHIFYDKIKLKNPLSQKELRHKSIVRIHNSNRNVALCSALIYKERNKYNS